MSKSALIEAPDRWTSGRQVSDAPDRADLSGPPAEPPSRRLVWWILGGIIATAGVAVHFRENLARRIDPEPVSAVRTAPVRSGTLERTLRLTGSTEAEHGVLLRTPNLRGRRSTGGGVNDFRLFLNELVDPGSLVKKGDVVAEFDPLYMVNRLGDERAQRMELQAALKRLRSEIRVKRAAHEQKMRVAQADIEKAQLDLKTAPVRGAIQVALFRLDFGEAQKLLDALREQTIHIEASHAADLRRAELELQEAAVEERRAAANLERMVTRAPINGVAIVREIYRGPEYGQIQEGDQLRPGQPFLRIVDPSSIIVRATANQVDMEYLRAGAPVHVWFDAYPGLQLPARVQSIGAAAQSGRRPEHVAKVPVVIKLDRTDPRVIPSLSVSAEVVVSRQEDAEIVPREAIFYPSENGAPHAFVQTSAGWEKRELELGLSNNVAVAVGSGVDAGEVVAIGDAPNGG